MFTFSARQEIELTTSNFCKREYNQPPSFQCIVNKQNTIKIHFKKGRGKGGVLDLALFYQDEVSTILACV